MAITLREYLILEQNFLIFSVFDESVFCISVYASSCFVSVVVYLAIINVIAAPAGKIFYQMEEDFLN